MESIGVYWIPLYELLEARGFTMLLVNARHVKNVSAASPMCWTASGYSSSLATACWRVPSG